MKKEDKFILDACCGGRMMWKNKNHPNAIYMDIRKEIKPLKEKYGMNFSVEPDVMGDFRKMPFPDKSFKLVLFDPPHMLSLKADTSWMNKKYGVLNKENWKEDIKKGFDECMRVLDDYGVLTFKWSDNEIPVKDVLALFNQDYLYSNVNSRKGKVTTYWFVFMKIPRENK